MQEHQDTNDHKNDNLGDENERRVDNLIDIVEKHTRTERHLEQFEGSGITSPENIEHAKKVQASREGEIDHLKNIISHGKHDNTKDLENTQKNYQYSEGYLNHNSDHMNPESLKNAEAKQAHRKEAIDRLE